MAIESMPQEQAIQRLFDEVGRLKLRVAAHILYSQTCTNLLANHTKLDLEQINQKILQNVREKALPLLPGEDQAAFLEEFIELCTINRSAAEIIPFPRT